MELILHDMVSKFRAVWVAPWQNRGDNWCGVASPSRSRLTLGLARREMKSKSTGVSSRGASPPPPSHSHHIPHRGTGSSLRHRGIALPFQGSVRFLPGDVSGAGGDAVARWILWAGREKFLDFFSLNSSFQGLEQNLTRPTRPPRQRLFLGLVQQ